MRCLVITVVDVSSPLNQAGNVRGRVVAVAQEGDSYIDSYSRNKQVLYGVVEADITASTKLTAGVEYQRCPSQSCHRSCFRNRCNPCRYIGVNDGFADKASGNGLKLNANQRSYEALK